MGFAKFELRAARRELVTVPPRVTISPSGEIRIGSGVSRALGIASTDRPRAVLMYDADTQRIALDFSAEAAQDPDSMSVYLSSTHAINCRTVHCRLFFAAFGIAIPDTMRRYLVDIDRESRLVVIDLTRPLDAGKGDKNED